MGTFFCALATFRLMWAASERVHRLWAFEVFFCRVELKRWHVQPFFCASSFLTPIQRDHKINLAAALFFAVMQFTRCSPMSTRKWLYQSVNFTLLKFHNLMWKVCSERVNGFSRVEGESFALWIFTPNWVCDSTVNPAKQQKCILNEAKIRLNSSNSICIKNGYPTMIINFIDTRTRDVWSRFGIGIGRMFETRERGKSPYAQTIFPLLW